MRQRAYPAVALAFVWAYYHSRHKLHDGVVEVARDERRGRGGKWAGREKWEGKGGKSGRGGEGKVGGRRGRGGEE